ncbi:class I SAM-dependent methyltransferase [Xanthobacteraceae bacterium A53D]
MTEPHPFRCIETGARLPATPGTLILNSGSTAYPQIDGIPTVQTRARARAELEAEIHAIRTGGRQAVLKWLADWSAGQGWNFEALQRVVSPAARSGFLQDWADYSGERDHYFLIRWACASHLANLAFLGDMAGRRVACLAGGIGHLSGLLAAIHPRPKVTLLDGNLIHLLVAKAYFAPDDQAVCGDLDDPLPLPDAAFDIATINDAFHYVDAQADLLGEMRRILKPDGQALILHIHDPRDLTGETSPGSPLAPQDFARMAHAQGWRDLTFHAERDLALSVARPGALTSQPLRDPAQVPPGPYAVRLRKGRMPAPTLWRLAMEPGQLMLNPIYVPDGAGSCRLDWRGSRWNETEFGTTPLPRLLSADELAGDAAGLFGRGILVPNPDGRLAPARRALEAMNGTSR